MEDQTKGIKNWVKVYPIYIDKNFKLSEGRKTGLLSSVENPSIEDIYRICSSILKLNTKVENVFCF